MSRIFVCLFELFILSIAIRFGDCENISQLDQCNDTKSGSDETQLSFVEKTLMLPKFIENKIPIFRRHESFEKSENPKEPGYIKKKLDIFIQRLFLIFPGTKWCGSGDVAKNKNDLGHFNDTDACCREHDYCKSNILGGETLKNLVNNGFFTRSHCDCDSKFYECLKRANSIPAGEIGCTYFSILNPQCFEDSTKCDSEDKDCKNCETLEWKDNPKWYNNTLTNMIKQKMNLLFSKIKF